MTERPDLADLLLQFSTDPETTTRVDLTSEVTCLGRPEPHEASDHYVDLKLENVSRRHARLVKRPTAYVLENWMGKGKIGLYETSMTAGESHTLRHNDMFRIPDVEGPFVRIIFVVGNQTRFLPLEVELNRSVMRVFGEEVKCTSLEHRLLAYLYQRQGAVCRYDEIIAELWPDAHTDGRKQQLDSMLSDIRTKIRPESGGFTFLETFPGEGIRMVI